jgi:hypothetical protein
LQAAKGLSWLLIVCCIASAALFGFACLFDDDGDFGVALRQADGPLCSPDEASRPLPVMDANRLLAGPKARTTITAPGLLAAVPGGLCLLI